MNTGAWGFPGSWQCRCCEFSQKCYLSGEGVENLGHQESCLPDGAELTREVGGKLIAR